MNEKPIKNSKKKKIVLISLVMVILLVATILVICGPKNINIASLRKRNYQ